MRPVTHGLRVTSIDTSQLSDRLVGLRRVAPWGHLVWPAAALLVLAMLTLGVRVGHAQSSSELRTHLARTRDAVTARERLRLEVAVRANDPHLREVVSRYQLGVPAAIVALPDPELDAR